jgi:V/A-type H+-transporting ATPase subunit I
MSRILIVGPKGDLEPTIEALYSLETLHLLDFVDQDEAFQIGKPLEKASSASSSLIKLRSICSVLELDESQKKAEVPVTGEIEGKITSLELQISDEDNARKNIESRLSTIDLRTKSLEPFSHIPLPLGLYKGYENLHVFVGRISKSLEGLGKVTSDFEVYQHEKFIALFVPKEKASEAQTFLNTIGFVSVEVPEGKGIPLNAMRELEAEKKTLTKRLEQTEDTLDKLKEKHAHFVLSAEDFLTIEVEKAEAPLRFATTEHSFAVDGWIPNERTDEVKSALAGMDALYIEEIEEEEEESPVLLDNPEPASRAEFFVHLFSTPKSNELDPTPILFFVFPLFFGFMIGDIGYGIVMIVTSLILQAKLKGMPDFRNLMLVMLWGGIFSIFFGLFVFGEAFGVELWEHSQVQFGFLSLRFPLFNKLHDVMDLIIISLVAALVHLGIGYVFGFINEYKKAGKKPALKFVARLRQKKHAIAKVGWLLILFGFFTLILVTAYNRPYPPRVATFIIDLPHWAGQAIGLDIAFPADLGWDVGGWMISEVGLISLLAGVFVVLFSVPMEAIEVIGLLANMFSYARLAGVAVAKGAMAVAFNTMLLPWIGTGEVGAIVVGGIFLLLSHFVIFVLGALSAGIQALRLNYVEFFLKFFEGNGQRFKPFGGPGAMSKEV